MVKFRGVEINVISQFDICKLPEYAATASNDTDPFRTTDRSDDHLAPSYPTATCYIPIYPGSQIWFEYTIDGPHPAGASYFFKLFVNDATVTSWDCTARHGFQGKMMYNLVHEGRGQVKRQALKFGDGIGDGQGEDVVRFHIYRIERRVRVREIEEGIGRVNSHAPRADGLRLINSGLLEPGFRPRRYKYQLVDPVDMPYAAFQFRCRPIEFLEEQRMIHLRNGDSPISARSSMTSLSSGNVSLASSPAQAPAQGDAVRPLASSPANKATTKGISAEQKDGEVVDASATFTRVPLSGSNDSLSIKTKDSIEELQSSVRRSPRSPMSPKTKKDSEIPPSPTRSPKSPRRRLTKKLTVTTNSAISDLERKVRPLSPFTGGGMLRKASLQAQTAPDSAMEFGPTDEEEVRANLQEDKTETLAKTQKCILRTTAEERGGNRLMGFLARRFASERCTKSNTNEASRCVAGRDNS
ncbi:hypothetical protein PV04_01312 [Phialophora macrospora]|uniref:Uncharacterized protein n=1 Tax=Phialophora macrospora TaxID=1851006 RepID=A0A0D2GLB8_9EURO|nr:hypothetical protein PV04_01312 [Phialophora macrospora]